MITRLVQLSPIPAFLACFALLASASRAGVVTSTNNAGAGSLRQAIFDAVSGDTITFAPALDSLAIVLTNELSVTKSLDIDASALQNGITIDGNDTTRVLIFHPGITNTLSGFTIQNGNNAYGGGINNSGDLTLNHMTLAGNHAAQQGGAIRHYDGRLTLNNTTVSGNTAPEGAGIHIENNGAAIDGVFFNNSTVAGNSATGSGGGIYQNSNTIIEINSCTLSGNSANFGGGIHSGGTLTLHNSTIANNFATNNGGGIDNSGTLTFNNSTLSDNTADIGGGIYNFTGTLHAFNSIIAGNTALVAADNVFGSLATDVNNLISPTPQLAPLGDYGGPTHTMPPLPGSTAIDDGLTSATNSLTDQRGFARVAGTDVDIGAVEYTLAMTVTSLADTGSGSLRQAILISNPGGNISFSSALNGATILLTSGQIVIDKNLTIDASDLTEGITINGNGLVTSNRIFVIAAHTTNVLDSVTLTNGLDIDSGGAIYVQAGADLTINRSTIAGNTAEYGGGIATADGTLTLNSSTIAGNSAEFGGGILNLGTLTLNSSTIAGNMATNSAGGIYNLNGTLTLNSSTLSDNMADGAGGIYNDGGTFNSTNSIVAGNNATIAANIAGPLTAGSNNLTNGPPGLAAFGDYGGPTQTMPPRFNSPAIDAGGATTLTTDQRGHARVYGAAVDLGAVELQMEEEYALMVSTTSDSGPGSLRQAILDAVPSENIFFSSVLNGATILLTSGQIVIDKNLTIDASDLTERITIDGNGLITSNRIFVIKAHTTNILDSITLTNGLSIDNGGAIFVETGANLTISRSTIAGNTAEYVGGGIANADGTLTLHNSTLSDNIADSGGGIFTTTSEKGSPITSSTTLNQCTLEGNTATTGGGVITQNGWTFMTNCTVTANTASDGAGVWTYGDAVTETVVANTIIAGNTGPDLGLSDTGNPNAFLSAGYNLIGNGSVSYFNGSGDSTNHTGATIQLAPLGNYGGPTQTMPPLLGSPAIDAGLTSATNSLTDQRGLTRVVNGTVDIGAVEYQGAPDNALFWMTDYDGDGNAFGVEYALGTDWFTADATNIANLAALSSGGVAFGFNPVATDSTAWILKRSLDLTSDPFVEVYRYDGPTDTTTTNISVTVTTTATGIEVQDHSDVTNVYYQFEAQVSP